MKRSYTRIVSVCFLLCLFGLLHAEPPAWYRYYKAGLKEMQNEQWQKAIDFFDKAIKIKEKDDNKLRAFGTIFIEYFPHREKGICLFNLGKLDLAGTALNTSLKHSPSGRTKDYLKKLAEKSATTGSSIPADYQKKGNENVEAQSLEIVGERLSIAVLPFSNTGLGNELASLDLLDKLITGFVKLNRFKVVERALLERVLEEQKLGMSGIVDPSTAAEIGRGIGVDAVVVGSVTRAENALSIDARFIDTETAAIITAKDAFSQDISLQEISEMISRLARKIHAELPVINGYVISVDDETITLDIGRSDGIRRGMKCHVYREGPPIIHPVSGEVIAHEINELCEAQLIQVFEAYSVADIIMIKDGMPKIRDKIVTK